MPIGTEKLSKIRRLSMRELRIRSRQKVAMLSDRLLRARVKEMSDEELFREIHFDGSNGNGGGAEDLLRHFLRSRNRCFLPSLEQRRAIVEVMNRRFPAERDAIIEIAEAALAG